MGETELFRQARDFLLRHREDYDTAYRDFRWPALDRFNWALDWFDVVAAGDTRPALRVFDDDGETGSCSFAELSAVTTRIASALADLGVARGDRILVMLGTSVPLWETMLAAMKLGAVVVPATSQLGAADLADRFARGRIRHVVADAELVDRFHGLGDGGLRIAVGAARSGWRDFATLKEGKPRADFGDTRASDPLLLYFTSGTTARPKLVLHTHTSYPVGHLSTMYWIGLRDGDVHLNVSSPGWAKHAWSSLFAPWNAGATVVAYDYRRFQPERAQSLLRDCRVTTLCAPPTVWRLLLLGDLGERPAALREAVSAGEPLNPEVIDRVKRAWGVTVRDGYGQTETTAQIGNSPGQPVRPGSMGRPLPGYRVTLVDSAGREVEEGEVALRLDPAPVGLMAGYVDDTETKRDDGAGLYRTGDEARREADGYLGYVARGDDVFKSADYRIGPFELESAILEHATVAEAAVVASPDPLRGQVPKAFVTLRPGVPATAETARAIFAFLDGRLAPYQRVRRLTFGELPKTVSGKIRRAELRASEARRGDVVPDEFRREDLTLPSGA